MNQLKFTVYENGKKFSCSEMSEPESFAIEQAVESLLPKAKGDYWFEVDAAQYIWDSDEEPDYGLILCYKDNPNPKNSTPIESKVTQPLPSELLDALQGKTFRVQPSQYGLNEWGNLVEIKFESIEKKGIKASALIQMALQMQKT